MTNIVTTAPAIEIENLSKSFAGVQVLFDVGFTVAPGEVHGLVGRNGSGKSTLIKILSGYHEPDPGGSLRIAGRDVALPVPLGASHRLGLSFVHQDLGLTPGLTVLENLRIGSFETGFGWRIRWREERAFVETQLRRFGVDASAGTLVRDLPAVDRALVAIVRALTQLSDVEGGGVLVLDEPTAYLPFDGVGRLFDAVREVAAQGAGVIFVSHRLEEISTITNRVSVLRDGRLVGTAETATTSEEQLIELILGGRLEQGARAEPAVGAERIMRARGLSGHVVRDLDLDLHRGEVLGLTGLIGMGHEEVPYLLFGAHTGTGTVEIGGRTFQAERLSPRTSIAAGMALVPADRQGSSGVASLTLKQNVTLPALDQFFVGGVLRQHREAEHARRLLTAHGVRPPAPGRPLGTLSGGNQQKALLAKWFQRRPSVLLLHEPTQGVDVHAREDIFREIRRVAEEHECAVLYISSDYDDFARICGRVLVFRFGRAVAELRGSDLSEERIVESCYATSA